jgi:hypothetical protein
MYSCLPGPAGRRVDQALLDLVDPGIRQQRDVEIRGFLGLVGKPQAGGDLGHFFLTFWWRSSRGRTEPGRSDSGFEIFYATRKSPSLRGAQRRSNPVFLAALDCFAELVIGREFARPVGSQ